MRRWFIIIDLSTPLAKSFLWPPLATQEGVTLILIKGGKTVSHRGWNNDGSLESQALNKYADYSFPIHLYTSIKTLAKWQQ